MSNKPWYWVDEHTDTFLRAGYIPENKTTQQRVKEIADTAEEILGIKDFSDKFYEYMSKGWYSLSSPVWANFGLDRGLPISCYNSHFSDSIDSIIYGNSEVGMMSKHGGGTSGYFGEIRGRGANISNNGKSNGSFPFLQMLETTINVISQGTTRRGQFAAYIDIAHPDIEEWLQIHHEGNPIQTIYYGVCVQDYWMEEMIAGDGEKRKIWAKVLKNRLEFGHPYIFFTDNVNNNKPQIYKDKGLKINASNLCSEINLPSTEEESFVCCLSSMNLLHYEEWKHTDAVETLTYFLDAVMEEFIQKSKKERFLSRATRFAENHRALGLGVLGWHSFLQSKNIPFGSFEAMRYNNEIFKLLDQRTLKATEELANLFGEAPILKGYKQRNTTRLAIAPTKSSSFILGRVSPSIEPLKSNYYVRDTAKMKFTYKNPYLKQVLIDYGQDSSETWRSILERDGSVQHLSFMSEHHKNVFKTFSEISQLDVIQQAAQRQKYIDQAQSLNITIHPKTPVKDINKLYITAWELGVKTLYYQNSINAAQEFSRELLTCSSCEG